MKKEITKNSILLWCAALFIGCAVLYPTNLNASNQWDMAELNFSAKELPAKPFDVDFTVVFKHENGKTVEVPGFYNGDMEYRVRFTPSLKGSWTYTTKSTVVGLKDKSGQLLVAPAKPGRKGGIIIDKNNVQAFQYKNGDDYYPIAYEVDWLFALDADNPTDIPMTKKLVDTAAESGFNQIIMNVFAYDVVWGKDKNLISKYEYGGPKSFPFGGDNTNPDHSTLNVEFFKRLDRVIQYLDDKDIASHLMIYVWNKKVNWPEPESEEDNRYYDYVVKRYQAYPNIVWDVSKEALAYGRDDITYISRRIERLRKLDAHKRLVTVHSYKYCSKFPENVDFMSVQDWTPELYRVMRNNVRRFKNHPVLSIEHGGYEKGPYTVFTGAYTDPYYCLDRAYKGMFAGAFPTHYWQGTAWNVVIPDISELKPEERPKLEYYGNMRKLVDRYPFNDLLVGTKSTTGYCRYNKDENLFIYMLPKETMGINAVIPKKYIGSQVKYTWFNPVTGKFSKTATQEHIRWNKYLNPNNGEFSILIIECDPSVKEK